MCRGLIEKKPSGHKRSSKNRNGFTLTEVIVASALLLAAIVPILKGLTNAHLTSVIIERKTRSLALAQGKLDEVKARSIYNYSSSFDVNNELLDTDYRCNVTDTSLGANLRKVKVEVGFDLNGNNSLNSDEVNISLVTKLAKRW